MNRINKISIFQNDSSVTNICHSDRQMKKLIHVVGDLEFELKEDYFKALTKSIISQQLSPKAAATIYSRFEKLLQYNFVPASLIEFNEEQLRDVGVSKQKSSYLFDLSNKILSEELNLDQIAQMDNEQVINTLTNVKGIGKWTAEMFLIFSLGKMNILPLDDVGIHRAVKWLYSLDKEMHMKDVKLYLFEQSKAWGTNSTIACLYLWEAVNRGLIQHGDVDTIIATNCTTN